MPDEDFARESVRVHATGLLAIALTHSSHCEEAVRSQFITPLVNHLHCSATGLQSSIELRSPTAKAQAVRPVLGNPHPVHRPLQVG